MIRRSLSDQYHPSEKLIDLSDLTVVIFQNLNIK